MIEWKLKKYNDFNCIGSACPRTCCGGWAISVNKASVDRYKSVTGNFGKEIMNSLMYDKHNNTFIKFNENGFCPLLNEDGLCRIYIEAGENMMCDTCKKYPRGEYVFGDLYLKYICISCPEMARILFTEKEPLKFEFKDANKKEIHVYTSDEYKWDIFYSLKQGMLNTIDILQNRNIKLSHRLQLILLFNESFQNSLQAGTNCFEILNSFSNADTINELVSNLKIVTNKNNNFQKLIIAFNHTIVQEASLDFTYIYNYIKEAFHELESSKNIDSISFSDFINNENNIIIFENFCVYYIMRHYLESYDNLNPCDLIVKMIQYCCLLAWLFGIYNPDEDRTLEQYTVIVSMLARKTEHDLENNSFFNFACKNWAQHGMSDVSYIFSIL